MGKVTLRTLAGLGSLPLAGGAVLAAQIFHAAHRPDLPTCANQDPSTVLGDPALPGLRVVALGDSSITSPGVVDLDNAWVRQCARYLSDTFRVELISVAAGGARARGVLTHQLTRAMALGPDLAIVSVGANDALRVPDVRRFERHMHEIVGALHRVADAVITLGVGDVGTIPRLPSLLSSFLTMRSRQVDRAVGRVTGAYPRASQVEAWGEISTGLQNGGLEMWSSDQFHVSDRGHLLFENEIKPALDEALEFLPVNRSVGGRRRRSSSSP